MRTGFACGRAATLGLALMTAALTLASPFPARAQGTPRVVEITAKRFEFTPKEITLKQGEDSVFGGSRSASRARTASQVASVR